ncbi:NnrU family protein [Ahrensia sp. R2A130]|uniref:NnrU family protein n=1 Tax=Ahrensia sp. R2A130 TaxID=744979 RepID=UPI0001E0F04C|nr:NnrU family protein [Ahrensia sp. R2A130]EFL90962.1 NnrU protein [Ahrensia sp. R2A130]
MIVLIIGLVLFLGVHFAKVIAPAKRAAVIADKGDGPWKGIYSVVSIIGLGLLIWGYGLARGEAGQLYDAAPYGRSLLLLAMPLAFVLLVASQIPAGYIKRAVRHPMVLAVVIWSAAHLTANGDTASVLLFGSFLVWSVVTTFDSYRRPWVAPAKTAIWADLVSVVVGLALTVAFISFAHEWLIGVGIV